MGVVALGDEDRGAERNLLRGERLAGGQRAGRRKPGGQTRLQQRRVDPALQRLSEVSRRVERLSCTGEQGHVDIP